MVGTSTFMIVFRILHIARGCGMGGIGLPVRRS